MGGFGSTRWNGHRRRPTVDRLPEFSAQAFARQARTEGIALDPAGTRIVAPVRGYSLDLVTTPCTYGGHRWWVLCPVCRRRCGKLYIRRESATPYACRDCLGLAYPVQRLGTVDRRLRRSGKILHQLVARGAYIGEDGRVYPGKWMHRSTFHRMMDAHAEHEANAILPGLVRLAQRIGQSAA